MLELIEGLVMIVFPTWIEPCNRTPDTIHQIEEGSSVGVSHLSPPVSGCVCRLSMEMVCSVLSWRESALVVYGRVLTTVPCPVSHSRTV
ncbi:unnamed protein product [Danaus chrysippus]|uniref:(African queen) hypothetical protein n=1 Tax=Danaus chrysippus TaxID=151541 RepID=A0A8J2R198_9NEOP|nr:unnamed protein product [Danaus chrysippus]